MQKGHSSLFLLPSWRAPDRKLFRQEERGKREEERRKTPLLLLLNYAQPSNNRQLTTDN
jgi:hypothetical protein